MTRRAAGVAFFALAAMVSLVPFITTALIIGLGDVTWTPTVHRNILKTVAPIPIALGAVFAVIGAAYLWSAETGSRARRDAEQTNTR